MRAASFVSCGADGADAAPLLRGSGTGVEFGRAERRIVEGTQVEGTQSAAGVVSVGDRNGTGMTKMSAPHAKRRPTRAVGRVHPANSRIGAPIAASGADRWRNVCFTSRSLIAAGALSLCALLTALSATAAVERAADDKVAAAALANEAELVASLAEFLAAETANTREGFDAPSLKPAKQMASIVAHQGGASDFVDFDFSQIDMARIDTKERTCLAQAIYYEAGNEPRVGQLAVADVILNRVKSPIYPDTICGVVFEGSHRRTGCQFSFTCDGSMKRRINERRMRQIEDLAGAIMAGVRVPVTRSATHYHAYYVSPPWSKTLTPTASIGAHRFYRFPTRTTVVASASAS